MARWCALALAAVAALAVAPAAQAQPAAAIGKPLPDTSLRDGTVVVRVVDADRAAVTGAEVTLILAAANGQGAPIEQRARTDAEGRASFTDVGMGVLVKATAPGLDGATVTSVQFPMPQTNGVRVMLSTAPVAGGDAPMMGGGAGGPPMSPRVMSGQPRPEQADTRDGITVRVSYDDFSDVAGLAGLPVVVVGYRHDQVISGKVVATDASGRAEVKGLDPRGATTYFAMTQLPRNGSFDRLTSIPILLDGEAGVRVILSGEKRAATTPAVDDLGRLDEQPKLAMVPAGVVRVQFAGVPEANAKVELLDAVTGDVIATGSQLAPMIALDSIKATAAAPTAEAALPAGTLAVTVTHEGVPQTNRTVTVRTPTGAVVATSATDPFGTAVLSGVPAGAVEIAIALDDDAVARATLTVPAPGKPATGVRATVDVAWTTRGEGGARFAGVVGGPDRAFAVRTLMRNQPYLSAPFQLTPDRGASITVLVMPRVMFQWSLTSWLDDVFLGVRGTFGIRNASWAPYLSGTDAAPDDLVLPLPDGFTGAVVRDDFQAMVGIDPAKGFVIRRPIPPGGFQFVAGFSLKVDHGTVRWSMPLPLGTFESGIELKKAGDARVVLPKGVTGIQVENVDDQRGQFAVLSPITILPGKTMQFEIRDLPREATWRTYGRRAVGLTVLALLALGTTLALRRPRGGAVPTARFDALLDELAALQASGADPARQAKLMAELETLYRKQPPR